jgi:predicted SprT family Zn-dependent metalloprotease
LNIDPSTLSLAEEDRDKALLVILHELTHLFGYSYEKFQQFVGADSQTPIPFSDVVFTGTPYVTNN